MTINEEQLGDVSSGPKRHGVAKVADQKRVSMGDIAASHSLSVWFKARSNSLTAKRVYV